MLADTYGVGERLDDVYAIGDLSGYPVKQCGLGAQQADAVAAVLAAQAGAPVQVQPSTRTLRVRLAGGSEPLLLSAELDAHGRPRPGTSTAVEGHAPGGPAPRSMRDTSSPTWPNIRAPGGARELTATRTPPVSRRRDRGCPLEVRHRARGAWKRPGRRDATDRRFYRSRGVLDTDGGRRLRIYRGLISNTGGMGK